MWTDMNSLVSREDIETPGICICNFYIFQRISPLRPICANPKLDLATALLFPYNCDQELEQTFTKPYIRELHASIANPVAKLDIKELLETGPSPLSSRKKQPSLTVLNKRPLPADECPIGALAKKQSKWSPAEDAEIVRLRGSGMKWDDISKKLRGRSAISCRLHYQNYLERRSEWDEEKRNRLARVYDKYVFIICPDLRKVAPST